MRFRRCIAVRALYGSAIIVLPIVTPTPAMAASKPEVIASGLDNPQKLSFGPDGNLYVSESGVGAPANATHSNCIATGDGGQEACVGPTGAVTKVDLANNNAQSRVVTNLPSGAAQGGEGASGPN